MNICFMCDLHLGADRGTCQYKVLDWAINDVSKKAPDCIVFAGDVTCDGSAELYREFIGRIESVGIPFLYIPGNSDLRSVTDREELKLLASPTKNLIGGRLIFALNDCDGTVTDEEIDALEAADADSVVFLHRPIIELKEPGRTRILDWQARHKNTMVFFGHKHRSTQNGSNIGLQAMDPDKAIGENPCITYYSTDTRELTKAYYYSGVPVDFYRHFGISCYDVSEHIALAIEYRLKNLELRKSCIDDDRAELLSLVGKWREAGGENLSIHLPDIKYDNGKVLPDPRLSEYMSLAELLLADRFTQHVPKVSVKAVRENPAILIEMAEALASAYNTVGRDIVIGVENMHMTAKDTPDDNRRFGYIPEECIEFMQLVAAKCRHKVGINLDVGHARNNAPYSQTYQIGTWYSMVGKYAVSYHIHQVNNVPGNPVENHIAIDNVYGRLISYSSFFREWAEGTLNKAPLIFEMRPNDAYRTTLETFAAHKRKCVFDLHAHTYYSGCSEDDPRELIKTAIASGLSLFAITDHRHGIKDRVAEYVSEIRALADEYKDRIKLLCGIEIATLPYKFDPNVAEVVGDCDFCLIEHIDEPESTVGKNLFEFARCLGIRCGIAHTDLFKYCDIYGYDYLRFFKRLADAGIFWELNVSYDSTHNYREHKYVREFMEDKTKIDIIKKAGVYVSVGFDSHIHLEYDAERVHSAYDFLIENGIKTADELFGGYEK